MKRTFRISRLRHVVDPAKGDWRSLEMTLRINKIINPCKSPPVGGQAVIRGQNRNYRRVAAPLRETKNKGVIPCLKMNNNLNRNLRVNYP